MNEDKLSNEIIGAAIDVHKVLGPGLLESAYEGCLAFELGTRGIPVERQKELPVIYKGNRIEIGYRLDLLVSNLVIIELKAVDKFYPIHSAQLLSYLKLTNLKLGILLNFNVTQMRFGIKRLVNNL